jgi:hypothetical protein
MNRQQAIEQASIDMLTKAEQAVECYLLQYDEWTDDLGIVEDYAKNIGTPESGFKERTLYTHPPKDTAERDALATKMNDEVNLYGRLTIKTILALYAYLTRDHIVDANKKVGG